MAGGRRHHRHEDGREKEHGVDERPEERARHRQRHGPEHLALDALEREQRDVDEHDDRHREGHGARHALRDLAVGAGAGVAHELTAGGERHHRLQDHDRAVDEEAEVDGAERHEIPGDAEEVHPEQRDAHRRGDADDHGERAADRAEEEPEHQRDDEHALDEVLQHGGDGAADEIGAVVDDVDGDAGRQLLLDLLDARAHVADHVAAVRAEEHHHDARHRLALALTRDDAVAERGRDLDLGDGAHEGRRAVVPGADDDVGDLRLIAEQPLPAYGVRLLAALDVAAADVEVGGAERLDHVGEREPVRLEPRAIDDDLELLELPAHRVDLDHAGDAAELGHDLPVEQRAELHRRVVIGADDELVDLAEPGGHRRELGLLGGGRELGLDAAQALEHELPREPHVGRVVEDHGDGREPAARGAADLHAPGDAVERVLDRRRHGALDLQRREPARAGEDRDLDGGDVGERVDGERARGPGAGAEEHGEQRQDDLAVVNRGEDEVLQHQRLLSGRARS